MMNINQMNSLSDCQRPVYTSYELSQKVKMARHESGLELEDFSIQYDVDFVLLKNIEDADRSFTPDMYKVCASILGLTIKDLIQVETDRFDEICYRSNDENDDVKITTMIANKIFNEIIMQKKISAR